MRRCSARARATQLRESRAAVHSSGRACFRPENENDAEALVAPERCCHDAAMRFRWIRGSLIALSVVLGASVDVRAASPQLPSSAAPGTAHARAVTTPKSEAATPGVARTHAGGGQAELVVGFDGHGTLRAVVCGTQPCALESGLDLELPATAAQFRTSSQLTIVPIGDARSAMVVKVPMGTPDQAWQAVIVGVPGQPKPRVVFKGFTGYVSGDYGLRQGRQVQIVEASDDTNSRRILVGDLHEDLTLCRREALLSPQLLDPRTLELKPAKVQRLSLDERNKAAEIVAQPIKDDHTSPAQEATPASGGFSGKDARLLRAVGASSAVGWPSALTDGDPETTWAENRGGAGRGEFVVMRALSDVPINAFDLLVRPAKKAIPNGVGAEIVWLVTTHDVYKVRFADDPWKLPGTHFRIALPHPVITDCVALVTDSAFGEGPKSEVTFAELSVRSEFESASIENLVGALAGGGNRAEAAGSVLSSLGEPAFKAVEQKFDSLDEGGRRVALDVMDAGPCTTSTGVYVKALLGQYREQHDHALERLRRCGDQAKAPLVSAVEGAKGKALVALTEALSEVAPGSAVVAIVNHLETAARWRKSLREVLSRATQSEHAETAIREVLAMQDLPLEAKIEFLRALDQRISDFAPASMNLLMQMAQSGLDWQHRYRLVDPAQQLAPANLGVRDWLARLMTSDESPYVRTEAVGSVRSPGLFKIELLKALEDPEVRVREAAAQALASRAGDFARAALYVRLRKDEWPMVRSASADALGAQAPDSSIDLQLAEALDDEAPMVRSHAIDALGHRQAFAQGSKILDHFQSRDENLTVRLSAARALGWLCYANAVSALSDRARTLKDPMLDAEQRSLAGVSLAALSRIDPSNLRDLLSPLLAQKGVAPSVKRMAESALQTTERCSQLH